MPWATNADLPGHICDALPAAAQTRFRQVANRILADGGEEKSAIRQAWHVVKQGWEKGKDGWVRKVAKAKPRTLYVCRYVQNAKDIIKWAKAQGFATTQEPGDMHVTVAFSHAPVDWMKVRAEEWNSDEDGQITIKPGGPRVIEALGDKGAVVLMFASEMLQWRHQAIRDAGASWDHQGYQPHVTITWDKGALDLSKVKPYQGEIVLGPEVFKEVEENWEKNITEKAQVEGDIQARVVKVDRGLGLVFGWAIISKRNGQDYYDLNIDSDGERVPEHIPEQAMLEAATDFMLNSRLAKEMHDGDNKGTVVFSFPLTTDVAKAMGITSEYTGLMIAMKPEAKMLGKFLSGELKGFSIGGSKVKFEDVDHGEA